MAPSRVGRSALRRSVNLVMGREHVAQRRRAHDTARQDLCNMILYVLTYYPNVGASKRETANGARRHATANRPAGGARRRAGAAAGRRGRGRNLARGSSRIDP